MKPIEFSTRDGFVIDERMWVHVDPGALGKRHHSTAQVVEPGAKESVVQVAGNRGLVRIPNTALTVQKSKCHSHGIPLREAPVQEKPKVINPPSNSASSKLQIPNAVTARPTAAIAALSEPVAASPAGVPVANATADDFDELASMLDRLRAAAHAKLMKLADDQKAARAMLAECESKIAAHLRQCTGLGIDLGNTRDLTAV